jgi:hypothetical protein
MIAFQASGEYIKLLSPFPWNAAGCFGGKIGGLGTLPSCIQHETSLFLQGSRHVPLGMIFKMCVLDNRSVLS